MVILSRRKVVVAPPDFVEIQPCQGKKKWVYTGAEDGGSTDDEKRDASHPSGRTLRVLVLSEDQLNPYVYVENVYIEKGLKEK